MKKILFSTALILAVYINKVSAQYITNYELGEGYTYFKSVGKSKFIQDHSATTRTYPQYMNGLGELVTEQQTDKNSLLNILERKNEDLAKSYTDKLYALEKSFGENYYKVKTIESLYLLLNYYTKQLEIISDYFKDVQNTNTEMEVEQTAVNEKYKKSADSIIFLQKQKFIREKEVYFNQLNLVEKDSAKFKSKLNIIRNTISVKYEKSIDLLQKEKKEEINQLPELNFSRNKDAVSEKYDKLISEKLTQQNSEWKDASAKFMSDNEQERSDYNKNVTELSNKINALNSKIDDINNNLESSLPTKPNIDEDKYKERLSKLLTESRQKSNSVIFPL